MAKPTGTSTSSSRPNCDAKAVNEFDYSGLSPEFSKLSKPAQRALVNNQIRTPKDLSRISRDEILSFHGIGPAALPILQSVLKKHGLRFRARK